MLGPHALDLAGSNAGRGRGGVHDFVATREELAGDQPILEGLEALFGPRSQGLHILDTPPSLGLAFPPGFCAKV
jgi:hypothetical protein